MPRKHCNSATDYGLGNFWIALIFSAVGLHLSLFIWCPKKINSVTPKVHLLTFKDRSDFLSLARTVRKGCLCPRMGT